MTVAHAYRHHLVIARFVQSTSVLKEPTLVTLMLPARTRKGPTLVNASRDIMVMAYPVQITTSVLKEPTFVTLMLPARTRKGPTLVNASRDILVNASRDIMAMAYPVQIPTIGAICRSTSVFFY
jgi:hypothetical protein